MFQNYHPSIIEATKGKVYDSQKYPLILNQTVYQLSLYKPDIKSSKNEITTKIATVNPLLSQADKDLIENFFDNQDRRWITLKHQFTDEQKSALNIDGLNFSPINKRLYPENNLAADILGNNESSGIQGYYRRQINGKTGFIWESKDATGKTLLTKTSWEVDSINGENIYTSINRQVQQLAETVLQSGIESYSADYGSITVIDPSSGQVIAMTSKTSSSSAGIKNYKNPIISNLYEPGSIFKPIVVAMALDEKKIDFNYVCTKCDSPHQIGEYSIGNWDNSLHPDSSLQDIIKNSDNIGMSYIIEKLGLNNFLDKYMKLGLNKKTGIDLLGESKPLAKDIWPEIDLATASFGQGLAITQIQMIQAFNAIANDGLLVNPRVRINQKTTNSRVFSQDTTNQVKSILKYSVENGPVSKFKPSKLEACAKSGTAQVAIKGGYSESSTIASYVGFSPCTNPKFTMLVTINNPKTSPWGSSTAAPIWFDLASKLSLLL